MKRNWISEQAKEDLLRQVSYLSEVRNEETAFRFLEKAEDCIQRIFDHSEQGSPTRLDHPKLQGVRMRQVATFPHLWIYYLESPKEIRILRILHTKRDVAHILEEDS